VNPKEDPSFQDFSQLFPAVLESLGVRVNTRAFGDRPIVAAIIRKDLIFCVAERRLNIFK
jgi:hypothetical protein